MRLIFITLAGLFLIIPISCSKLRYKGADVKHYDREDNPRGQSKFVDLEDIKDIDYKEILKSTKTAFKCKDYESGAGSFRISSALGVKIFEKMENCISKAIDKSVGKLCEQERKLDELEDKHEGDEDALEQIEEARYELENVKLEAVDNLLIVADELDELHEKLDEEIDDVKESWLRSMFRLFSNSEVGGFTRLLENKATRLCGYNIFKKDEDDD